ncbi:MAG: hypothetical protein JW946_02120, partial [Candidatus Omnitrophica bacterium]|nr:hypothetical protein [Candidatus Omnitrophota bacterium]
MLVLTESFLPARLLDRPDLGIASLIASCRAQGIGVSLAKGQTRVLGDMFMRDTEELWHMIRGLKEKDIAEIEIFGYETLAREKGVRQFCAEFQKLYNEIIINKNPRCYFNVPLLRRFEDYYTTFRKVYYYYFNKLCSRNLKIVDCYVEEIKRNNPSCVGFSFPEYPAPLFLHVAKRVKKETGVPLIAGGAFATYLFSEREMKFLLENYFDYIVTGAAERALPRLLESLRNSKEPKNIPNLSYMVNGRLKSARGEVIDNLDALPLPDFSEFDLDRYLSPRRALPIQTARGCFWRKCAFCDYRAYSLDSYKTFSIERVIECVKYLRDVYDCRHIMIHDDAMSVKRIKAISKAVVR